MTAFFPQPVELVQRNADGTFTPSGNIGRGGGFNDAVTLTVTNGAYTIGDAVGGLITLPSVNSDRGRRAMIDTINLLGQVAIAYDLWFLNADLATPIADNGVLALAAADIPKILGMVKIIAGDYSALASTYQLASKNSVNLAVTAAAGSDKIYAYMKATAVTSPGTTSLYLYVAGHYLD